ncbi:MAG: 1-acyl-sn-glycerol-3-phosphate acyltransferase [Bacteroidia bacterium]|nr:1-acyl-sn-glycerol-3-phosphate acyltransferase [Bacteroidia bacterium]
MKKILDYLLSSVYLLYFGILIVLFHPVQMFCFHLLGRRAHQTSVAVLNSLIMYGWYLTGSSMKFVFKKPLPTDRPLIIIANHQSMFDIPPILWFMRRNFPLFVSKIELGKGIPSISYNLRVCGSALIDRKDSKQAVEAIAEMGKFISKHNFSAAIFPEGTRSKTGEMKAFAVGGVATLLKNTENALVVPVAIRNTRKFNPTGMFPLTSFTAMSWTVLEPIEPAAFSAEEVVKKAEEAIRQVVNS